MHDQLLRPVDDASNYATPLGADNITFRERLVKLFGPTEFVKVINADEEAFTWQFLPETKEQITFDGSTSTVPQKNTYREPAEVYRLEPGQTAVIMGANAYVMIEGLAKQMIAHRTIARNPNIAPGQARAFNFTDGVLQEEIIKQIYLGKDFPSFSAPAENKENTRTNEASVNSDLGLSDDDLGLGLGDDADFGNGEG